VPKGPKGERAPPTWIGAAIMVVWLRNIPKHYTLPSQTDGA
jgi:hypothetical protein